MATNITEEYRRAFERAEERALRQFLPVLLLRRRRAGRGHRRRLSHEPEGEGETEYGIHQLFVSVTPAMRLTDHDGTEA